MKRILFSLLLIAAITTTLYAATIEGALGVTWGMKPKEAAKIVLARHGTTLYNGGPREDGKLTYSGGVFADIKVSIQVLRFSEEGLYAVAVMFDGYDTDRTQYAAMKEKFDAKYGESKAEEGEEYKITWTASDGNTVTLANGSTGTSVKYYDVERFTRFALKKKKPSNNR